MRRTDGSIVSRKFRFARENRRKENGLNAFVLITLRDRTLTTCRVDQDQYESEIKPYSWREQRDDRGVSLDFAISKDTAAGFHFSEWLHIDGEANAKIAAVLEGRQGRRLKLRYPQKFLKEKVMTQQGCDEWIRTQASISFKGKFGHHKWKAPEIWMVTGLQLVTGGDVYAAGSRDKKVEGGLGADPSVAAGLPPGTLKVKAEASHEHSEQASNGYGYEDERVWAAQFMEIDIEYGDDDDPALQKREKSKDMLPKTIADFRLKDIADLRARGIRGLKSDGEKRLQPKLRARIVAHEDEELPEDPDGIDIDELPYVDALKGTSWDDYYECFRYLDDIARDSPVSD
ncbi:hypothetical protein, variant [Verruconis gallopava]|uniref:Uncharacterized protein n=1 Tax=Verruconis gallopava TaxID=253628 RepID=A0A0D2B811_9PEZI|nr:hypothetical protein, variant [Verruconis gallopava]KIW07369.1 hypothetical protein, variant [Verruconis gallopava]